MRKPSGVSQSHRSKPRAKPIYNPSEAPGRTTVPVLAHNVPPALAQIAAGRDHILTEEFAKAANRAAQTIRKNYCTTGECFGIRPVKFGNRLLWPVGQIASLLNNGDSIRTLEPRDSSRGS